MKKANTILIMFLSVMTGCGKNNQPANEVSTVDVTTKYPYKELILQDFMDVEYIPLETTDEFLCMGSLWGVGRMSSSRQISMATVIFLSSTEKGKP